MVKRGTAFGSVRERRKEIALYLTIEYLIRGYLIYLYIQLERASAGKEAVSFLYGKAKPDSFSKPRWKYQH
jgi:hypothetical protein